MQRKATINQWGVLLLILFMAVLPCLGTAQSVQPAQAIKVDTNAKVTLNLNNARISQMLEEITKQTNFQFGFAKPDIKGVYFKGINVTLGYVFAKVLPGLNLEYHVYENFIVLERSKKMPAVQAKEKQLFNLVGYIYNEEGEPVQGINAIVGGFENDKLSDQQGMFSLLYHRNQAIVSFSGVNYERRSEIVVAGDTAKIILKKSYSKLSEVVVIAYGKSRQRENPGSVAKITGADIESKPYLNPLTALSEKIPGMMVTPFNGNQGTAPRIAIRAHAPRIGDKQGPNDLPAAEPLIVVDGIPWVTRAKWSSKLNGPGWQPDASGQQGGGYTLQVLLNSYDIESIEVLKDADATAIYGSLAADGAILITTKKGRIGKPRLTGNIKLGWGQIADPFNFLNTQQYLAMRREAPGNDVNDLRKNPELLWDTTRYTDLYKTFLGNTALFKEVHLQANGGSQKFNYNMGMGGRRSGTVFPGDFAGQRITGHLSLRAKPSAKLQMSLTLLGGSSEDRLPALDMIQYSRLPPNIPAPYDADGNLVWEENNTPFDNPWARLLQEYITRMATVLASGMIAYQSGRTIYRLNAGFHKAQVMERITFPAAANPSYAPRPGAVTFANTSYESYILEPQLEYFFAQEEREKIISLLFGATYLNQLENAAVLFAEDYSNDGQLHSPLGAGKVTELKGGSRYRYSALFGRLHLKWLDKYVANFTARLDGTGRIGTPGKVYPYGAIALAWIFGEERLFRDPSSPITGGKLRVSLGTTGNDPALYETIGVWSVSGNEQYGGTTPLQPDGLADYYPRPELNTKLEGAFEVEIAGRLSIIAALYSHRTSRQIVATRVPGQSGTSVIRGMNVDAMVQNTGYELTMEYHTLAKNKPYLSTQLVLSGYRNRLMRFEDLENALYAPSLKIGQPLTAQWGYEPAGVDPVTGRFRFVDQNNDGKLDKEDHVVKGAYNPSLYAAWTTKLKWNRLEFSFCVDWCRQMGIDPVYYWGYVNMVPGKYNKTLLMNLPEAFDSRWRHAGDVTRIQQVGSSSDITGSIEELKNSTAFMTDMSYWRLKSAGISFDLPLKTLKQVGLKEGKISVSGYNLLVSNKEYNGDPTIVQSYAGVPMPRTFMITLEVKL